jgi:hypothetical protein
VGSGLAFTPDSRIMAVGDPGGSILLVEPGNDRLIATLEDPNSNRAVWATFTPDGSRLILTSQDSLAAHVWDLRAIREQLAEMGLDWDWPRLPAPGPTTATPLRVECDLGELSDALRPRD